ncbi:MAG TPA: DUF4097 family beta strand repeat-containing protein [Clostridia bacterium]|nr:DUF4097 family beta strand repeat-containing protein [Clostridia bacterium]
MSISEERMMILKMLQEGRINSEEAAKLLEALDNNQKQAQGPCGGGFRFEGFKPPKMPQHNYYDEVARVRERINDWRREISKNYNQKDFDKMVDEFSTKAEKFGKDVTNVAMGVADKVVDFVGSVVDTGTFNFFGSCVLVEKTYEAAATEGVSLELQAANGQITVKKHDENRILIKAKIRTPQENAETALSFSNENGTVSLKLAKPDTFNLSVAYEVFVPAVKLNRLVLETKNSKIYVEDTVSAEFTSVTKNGGIDLTGVTGDKIFVDTKNGKVDINYLIGKEISINTRNASIEVKNLKAGKTEVITQNGKILVENVQSLDGADTADLVLKTKNADIKANMNDSEEKGYRVNAQTTNGGINLLIPNLLYRNASGNEGFSKKAEAETENYSNATQKVNIYAETQNGYIEVIK